MRSLLVFPCHGVNGGRLNGLGKRFSDAPFLADELEFIFGDELCASFWGRLYRFGDSGWLVFLDLGNGGKDEIIIIKVAQ